MRLQVQDEPNHILSKALALCLLNVLSLPSDVTGAGRLSKRICGCKSVPDPSSQKRKLYKAEEIYLGRG